MTKKDYIIIAKVLAYAWVNKEFRSEKVYHQFVYRLTDELLKDNLRFNLDKFNKFIDNTAIQLAAHHS